MTLSMPMNVFTIGAFILMLVYFAPRIGDKQANYQHAFIVIVLTVLLFCIGIAPMQIWHIISGGH